MIRLLGLLNYNRIGSSCCTAYTCFRDRLNKSVIPLSAYEVKLVSSNFNSFRAILKLEISTLIVGFQSFIWRAFRIFATS